MKYIFLFHLLCGAILFSCSPPTYQHVGNGLYRRVEFAPCKDSTELSNELTPCWLVDGHVALNPPDKFATAAFVQKDGGPRRLFRDDATGNYGYIQAYRPVDAPVWKVCYRFRKVNVR